MPSSNTTKMTKRALLIRNANSFDFGGAERFVVALAEELRDQGWDPLVVSHHKGIEQYARQQKIPFHRGFWWRFQDYSGLHILLFPLYVLWQAFLTLWYIYLLLKTGAEVIHPQSRDDFISATLAGHLLKRRVVWTDHADLKYIYQNVPVPIKNPIGKWVHRTSTYAHAITLVSHSEMSLIAESLQLKTLPSRYQVIYNGIRDTAVTAVNRTKSEQSQVIFCCTSRLVAAKGIGELITAFSEVTKVCNATLWIVGDGPDATGFRKQATGHQNIVFKGFQKDALPFVAACDVFVHPSYHEGFSLSIVEAAKLGKPMIACNVGGNPEIVHDGKNGILVTVRDVHDLAAAMLKLASSQQLRERYGMDARTTFLSRFEFDNIVKEKFIPIYEK